MRHSIFIAITCMTLFFYNSSYAQLYINGGQFLMDTGSVLNVKGDLTLNSSIGDSGRIVLNGSTAQYLGTNNIPIPNLEINNAQNVTLNSNTRVQGALIFTNGKIYTGNNNLVLSSNAGISGMGTSRFIETNGTGKVVKEMNSNLSSFLIPVGISAVYRPVYLNSQSASYSNASVDVKAYASVHPNKPSTGIVDYLKNYWTINRTGFSGSLDVSGKYSDPADVTGYKTNLRGYFYDGMNWSSLNGTYNSSSTLVGAPVTGQGGVLYGMNQYIVSNIKLYLQGLFNSSTGLMSTPLYDLGLSSDPTASDSINIELWSPSALTGFVPQFSFSAILHKDGNIGITLPEATLGNSYYVAVKGRNILETWSAAPVFISNTTSYDFTNSLGKAYGDGINPPMANVGNNTFVLYGGDINKDGAIDLLDMIPIEYDASLFSYGFQNTDCNGDGATDLLDLLLVENNSGLFIYYARP